MLQIVAFIPVPAEIVKKKKRAADEESSVSSSTSTRSSDSDYSSSSEDRKQQPAQPAKVMYMRSYRRVSTQVSFAPLLCLSGVRSLPKSSQECRLGLVVAR